jgi:hypothetical protein
MSMVRECSLHPQRPAYAVCMSCRRTLCQECATQWDGVWHCTQCLTAKRSAPPPKRGAGGWIAVSFSTLLLLYLGSRFLVWTGVLLGGLR